MIVIRNIEFYRCTLIYLIQFKMNVNVCFDKIGNKSSLKGLIMNDVKEEEEICYESILRKL